MIQFNVPIKNIFTNIPLSLPEEFFEVLGESDTLRIERIVSEGHTTAPGEWYDQQWDEWVLLLSGGALLRLEEPDTAVTLNPGDHLLIPAHRRHRVEMTTPGEKTIWLAVHFRGSTKFPPQEGER